MRKLPSGQAKMHGLHSARHRAAHVTPTHLHEGLRDGGGGGGSTLLHSPSHGASDTRGLGGASAGLGGGDGLGDGLRGVGGSCGHAAMGAQGDGVASSVKSWGRVGIGRQAQLGKAPQATPETNSGLRKSKHTETAPQCTTRTRQHGKHLYIYPRYSQADAALAMALAAAVEAAPPWAAAWVMAWAAALALAMLLPTA